jgi:hypothetical protein
MLGGAIVRPTPLVCTAPVSYRNLDSLRRDIQNLKAAATAAGAKAAFMPSIAPTGVGTNDPILILDLHLIGLWRRAPLAGLSRTIVPVGKTGFVIAAASGLCLLSSNATEYTDNPFFLIKFPAIGLGLLNVWLIGRSSGWRARGERDPSAREGRQLAVLGALSLASWLTAIRCGPDDRVLVITGLHLPLQPVCGRDEQRLETDRPLSEILHLYLIDPR